MTDTNLHSNWAESIEDAANVIQNALGDDFSIVWNFQDDITVGDGIDPRRLEVFPISANRESFDRTSYKITFVFYMIYDEFAEPQIAPSTLLTDSLNAVYVTDVSSVGDSDFITDWANRFESNSTYPVRTPVLKKIVAVSYPRKDSQ